MCYLYEYVDVSVITGSLLQENLKLKEQLSKLQEGLAIAANPVRHPTHVICLL